MRNSRRREPVLACLGTALLLLPGVALAQSGDAQFQWVDGPTKVDLGSNVAQLDLAEPYAFAGAADTQRLMEMLGNQASRKEVGMIRPRSEEENWLIVFEWDSVGYVKDDDKNKLDADELLDSFRRGTEEQNKVRKERGIPGIHVVGWAERPHYDERTHNLVWALHGRDDQGGEFVNYNVRLLGREGYMSVTLIEDLARFAASKPQVERVLGSFSYVSGKTYAEFKPGDKIAEFGLAALVAGGAGVAAAKLGLFAVLGKFFGKFWKMIVLALAGLGAALKKLLGGRSGATQG